jgi:thiopeptide-type bacteriocin biosynthesis protein
LTSPPAPEEFLSSGFFVLRTPLLPIEELLNLLALVQDRDEGHALPDENRSAIRSPLRTWVERPEVSEALWLASPDLMQSLAALQEHPANAKGRRLEQTLYRYLARMTARATPFGAFAGCTLGQISDDTRLELGPRGQYHRSTRLDMEYLCNLAESLSVDPAHRGAIRFRCNSSLHLAAGKYHHLRGERQDGNQFFHLVATDPTPALDATLLRATTSATANTLAAALVESDPEITLQEAEAFVALLIDTQLLVSELVPPVTGTEPVTYMVGQLEEARAMVLAENLRALAARLSGLDAGGLGADLRYYQEIAEAASRLGGKFTAGRLVQMDVMKPAISSTLDRQVINDIADAIQALHSICSDSTQTAFQPFIDQLQERYQEQEVTLLEALDDEAGIGFESEDNPTSEALIAGIDFRAKETTPPDEGAKASPLLARRLQELLDSGGTVLELDTELIEELRVADPLPLPNAFYVMGAVIPRPQGKPGFYLQNVCGPSGANLLARFCHADEPLSAWVKKHIEEERALHGGDTVFAEIAHLPEGRVGNVVCRPVLRQYEIPFLATSGVPAEQQIPLSDLTVSVRDGRIVLRSRRLGLEVIPRLTSAHNFIHPRSLKLYKFLCLLQHQGTTGDLFWSWGAHEQSARLPRVAMGNIIFSMARWRINQETVPGLFSSDAGKKRSLLEAWRRSAGVPRFVFVAEADNQLLIDLENVLSVEMFFDHIRKRPETILVEMLPCPDALAAHGPEGTFVHELILPFVRKASRKVATAKERIPGAREPGDVKGVPALAPDSQWLFAKLYCSPSHADRLLLELVRPLVEKTTKAGDARGWFFIRYGDPRWHLRLRFHGAAVELKDHVLPSLQEMAAPFQKRGVLWRMQFETYEPEQERYGGPAGTGVAEQFFQFDSELCLELLPLISEDGGAELRWQLAFAGADRLLSALGFNLEEKKSLVEELRDSREQAWIVDDGYRKQMARKVRSGELRRILAAIIDNLSGTSNSTSPLPPEALSALAGFSGRLQIIRAKLRELEQAGQLTASLGELAASYVHMHLNRILRSCHMEQEAVICDLLARTYVAKLARKDGI